jgi:hypothetical protein
MERNSLLLKDTMRFLIILRLTERQRLWWSVVLDGAAWLAFCAAVALLVRLMAW